MDDGDERDDQPDLCEACGEDLGIDVSRVYPLDEDRTLCFECAVERGGVYDSDREVWIDAPDVAEFFGDEEHGWSHRRVNPPPD